MAVQILGEVTEAVERSDTPLWPTCVVYEDTGLHFDFLFTRFFFFKLEAESHAVLYPFPSSLPFYQRAYILASDTESRPFAKVGQGCECLSVMAFNFTSLGLSLNNRQLDISHIFE